jgi:hypothetical protein
MTVLCCHCRILESILVLILNFILIRSLWRPVKNFMAVSNVFSSCQVAVILTQVGTHQYPHSSLLTGIGTCQLYLNNLSIPEIGRDGDVIKLHGQSGRENLRPSEQTSLFNPFNIVVYGSFSSPRKILHQFSIEQTSCRGVDRHTISIGKLSLHQLEPNLTFSSGFISTPC